jgi:C4-dicarboxylate-specific signal transduction histidine kinase
MMIATYKRFDGWTLGSDKFGESSGEREGNFGKFHHKPHPKTSLHPSQTNRENNQVGSLVRSRVKSLTPSLSQDQSVSFVSFVERMVTRESFAIRERERREWLSSGRTRTGTTLIMVCMSLVCHCQRERALCVRFRHREMRAPAAEVVVWRGRSDRPGMAVRPTLPREWQSDRPG